MYIGKIHKPFHKLARIYWQFILLFFVIKYIIMQKNNKKFVNRSVPFGEICRESYRCQHNQYI